MIRANSKEEAQSLRKAVMDEFANLRPWVCVFPESNDKFRIEVRGYWDQALSEEDTRKVQTFLMQKVAEFVPPSKRSDKN